jgi:predicted transcriptional regulator of viral defense system
MAIQAFLGTHQVFTIDEFAAAFPDSQTDRNLLARAVRGGAVDHVRRGLYVSKTGRYEAVRADPFDVALAVAPEVVFCRLSALQLHGVSHNLVNQVQFYPSRQVSPFDYEGVSYLPHRPGGREIEAETVFAQSAKTYRVTTREQTLVDCLVRVSSAGGPEHLLRSLAGLAYLDIAQAVALARSQSLSLTARLGWTLDTKRADWRVGDDTLSALRRGLGAGPYYFWSSVAPKDSHWVKRWKLYLPFPEEEMEPWLSL